jgi:hypothetical protein
MEAWKKHLKQRKKEYPRTVQPEEKTEYACRCHSLKEKAKKDTKKERQMPSICWPNHILHPNHYQDMNNSLHQNPYFQFHGIPPNYPHIITCHFSNLQSHHQAGQ